MQTVNFSRSILSDLVFSKLKKEDSHSHCHLFSYFIIILSKHRSIRCSTRIFLNKSCRSERGVFTLFAKRKLKNNLHRIIDCKLIAFSKFVFFSNGFTRVND